MLLVRAVAALVGTSGWGVDGVDIGGFVRSDDSCLLALTSSVIKLG